LLHQNQNHSHRLRDVRHRPKGQEVMNRHDDYATTRAKAIEVIREETVNGTTIGLFKVRHQGNKYRIVTSGGGSQAGIRTENSARFHFDSWIRSLERRTAA
jgi:hypothetical protein